MNKKYRQTDKKEVYLTRGQRRYLKLFKLETGINESEIVRKAVELFRKKHPVEDRFLEGDKVVIPNGCYDYFQRPSKIVKIEGNLAWLDVPDKNPVDVSLLKRC